MITCHAVPESVRLLATLSPNGRVDKECVEAEIARLERLWIGGTSDDGLAALIPAERLSAVDPFDRVQLAEVIRTCRASRSLSEAGRALFAASRQRRASTNDADRLRKYLARYELAWDDFR